MKTKQLKTKHYILIGIAIIAITAIIIPMIASNTTHIHAEDGTVIDSESGMGTYLTAYWKAKVFGKGGLCKVDHSNIY